MSKPRKKRPKPTEPNAGFVISWSYLCLTCGERMQGAESFPATGGELKVAPCERCGESPEQGPRYT